MDARAQTSTRKRTAPWTSAEVSAYEEVLKKRLHLRINYEDKTFFDMKANRTLNVPVAYFDDIADMFAPTADGGFLMQYATGLEDDAEPMPPMKKDRVRHAFYGAVLRRWNHIHVDRRSMTLVEACTGKEIPVRREDYNDLATEIEEIRAAKPQHLHGPSSDETACSPLRFPPWIVKEHESEKEYPAFSFSDFVLDDAAAYSGFVPQLKRSLVHILQLRQLLTQRLMRRAYSESVRNSRCALDVLDVTFATSVVLTELRGEFLRRLALPLPRYCLTDVHIPHCLPKTKAWISCLVAVQELLRADRKLRKYFEVDNAKDIIDHSHTLPQSKWNRSNEYFLCKMKQFNEADDDYPGAVLALQAFLYADGDPSDPHIDCAASD